MAETMDNTHTLSEREMRLRKRNMNKDKNKVERVPFVLKNRSDKTYEELGPKRRYIQLIVARNREKRERCAKWKAERLEKEKEEPWPPVWKPIKESLPYKCGLIQPYVDDLWGILNMDQSHFSSDPIYNKFANGDPAAFHEKLKAFLNLVRDSRGFDVNWVPPPCVYSPFRPIDVDDEMKRPEYRKFINPMLECTLERINARAKVHGEVYKRPFKVKKIVEALQFAKCLITFSVNLVSDKRVKAVKDVQAFIQLEGGGRYDCLEWRFKDEERKQPSEDEDEDVPSTNEPSKRRRTSPRSTSHSNAAKEDRALDMDIVEKIR